MKKIFLHILLFAILVISDTAAAVEPIHVLPKTQAVITDELLKHESFNGVKPHVYETISTIKDELLDTDSQVGNVFKISISKSGEYIEKMISDELISPEFIAYADKFQIEKPQFVEQDFIVKKINLKKVRKINHKNKYDFTKKQIPINIKLTQNYNHKRGKFEGDVLEFITQHDFEINGKKYPKGTIVLGRIENISSSDKMGTPETIKIDNFFIDNNPEISSDDINLNGAVTKSGANRSVWVYPLYQAGNIAFYVAGFVFVPIHGGHAKISAQEDFTVFYETP